MPDDRPRYLQEAVLRSLQALRPADAARIAWTGARFPTLADVSPLRHLVHSLGLSRTRLLSDDSPQTRLEGSDGNWEGVMHDLGAGAGGSVAELSAAFRLHVAPSAPAPRTGQAGAVCSPGPPLAARSVSCSPWPARPSRLWSGTCGPASALPP